MAIFTLDNFYFLRVSKYLQDDYKFILLPDKTCNVYAQTAYSNEYWNS